MEARFIKWDINSAGEQCSKQPSSVSKTRLGKTLEKGLDSPSPTVRAVLPWKGTQPPTGNEPYGWKRWFRISIISVSVLWCLDSAVYIFRQDVSHWLYKLVDYTFMMGFERLDTVRAASKCIFKMCACVHVLLLPLKTSFSFRLSFDNSSKPETKHDLLVLGIIYHTAHIQDYTLRSWKQPSYVMPLKQKRLTEAAVCAQSRSITHFFQEHVCAFHLHYTFSRNSWSFKAPRLMVLKVSLICSLYPICSIVNSCWKHWCNRIGSWGEKFNVPNRLDPNNGSFPVTPIF